MVEQTTIHSINPAIKSGSHRLNGFWLWFARGCYFLLLLLLSVLFAVGFPSYLKSWTLGGIGAYAFENSSGNLYLSISPAGDAAKAGVQPGDILIEINGVKVTSAQQANQLLIGRIGDQVTINVRHGQAIARTYSLVFAGAFMQLIDQMHITLQFITIYNITVDCLLTLGVIISSLLVFFRRSHDWLAILVAYAMVAYSSLLLASISTGAQVLHASFLNNLIYNLGMAAMFVVFFVFPTGHFEPRWTRWATILVGILAALNFVNLLTFNNSIFDLIVWSAVFILGIFAQIYRYWRVSTPSERQQTKRLVFGMVACFLALILLDISTMFAPRLSYAQYILFALVLRGAAALPVLILDLSFVFAIYRYRLWDTDLYLNRTLVYTLLTGSLVLVWVVTSQVLNYACEQLLGKQAGWLSALLSSLQVAVIYKPVRAWVEKWVNSRFYKDRIDYAEALVELKPEMWNYLTLPDLGHILVTKVPDLLKSSSAALFIHEKKAMKLVEVQNMHPFEASQFHFSTSMLEKMHKGQIVTLSENESFALLVPLTVPRLNLNDLVGVLAIGHHSKGAGYSRDHITDLTSLGQKAGLALYMLQLNERKQSLGIALPPPVSP